MNVAPFLGSGVAMRTVAGRSTNHITKYMTNSNLSLANRKQLADMLSDKYDGMRYKAKQRFREQRRELYSSLLNGFAEKQGALAIVKQIGTSKARIADLEGELAQLGFELDDDDIDFTNVQRRTLRDRLEKQVDMKLGTEAAIEARFDSAQLALMTVATLEDAEKILKSVSEL